MLDIKWIRTEPDQAKAGFRKREMDLDAVVDEILSLDEERRAWITKLDALKANQNAVSKKIPQMKKAGEDTAEVMAEMKQLSEDIKQDNAKLAEVETKQNELMLTLPNLPDEDVPAGGKEQNVTLREYGQQPVFNFPAKSHMELCEELNLVDYERGARLGGNGSWVYRGKGSRLEWALLNYFIAEHLADGYEFLLPPHMLVWECGTVAGQFPKFSQDVFQIANPTSEDKKFLLPTSETALVNMHRGEIMAEEELPKKYVAYTPCYRREAGSYRSEERGMIRGHQFNKVEMLQYTAAEDADAAFDELLGKAEKLVQQLGLHHRVSQLAAGDVSASMARTVDIEVWLPSMGIYKEVSSASNARAYQARRGNIRYRDENKKVHFANTLNASGLATSRVFPAILEQCQNADGSITVPEVLRPFAGFEKIDKE